MSQGSLFKDLLTGRLAAIGADVDAAGGAKDVGRVIWPKLSPDACQRRMSNLLNHKQKHEFTDEEVWAIKQLAYEAIGRSEAHIYESGEMKCELKWLTPEDLKERRKKRIAVLMSQLQSELAAEEAE